MYTKYNFSWLKRKACKKLNPSYREFPSWKPQVLSLFLDPHILMRGAPSSQSSQENFTLLLKGCSCSKANPLIPPGEVFPMSEVPQSLSFSV